MQARPVRGSGQRQTGEAATVGQAYDAVRVVISNVGAADDADAWRAFLASEGWTVAPGWGTDPVVAWADRRDARTVPTRRTLIQVLRERHADAGVMETVTLRPGEAVIDLTYYRAVDRK